MYLTGEIDKVIAEIEEEAIAQVVGIVTNNAKNMRSASGQVETRRPNVIGGGCSAHVLNLLMQDIGRLPAVKAVPQELWHAIRKGPPHPSRGVQDTTARRAGRGFEGQKSHITGANTLVFCSRLPAQCAE
ncbi:unnamed protein product [Phytophthora fragariaefolia]|uniref:Unnamed protein product n=1 Tax=Phytophthora fragariaefolia TaxID=1490495 RepID=A0A9W6TNL4_9STRA|nr:unnamed protein product [Phytophthora fragariaefolia]